MEIFRSTKNLSSYFNSHLPLPQNKSWKEYKIPKKLASRVISCLCVDQFLMKSLCKMPGLGRIIGVTGTINISNSEQIHTFIQSSPVNNKLPSRNLPSWCAPGLTVKEIRYLFNLPQMRLNSSPIPASWLGKKIPFTK